MTVRARPDRVVVAITGASGSIYGIRALELLRAIGGTEIHLLLTGPARTTLGVETDHTAAEIEALADVVHPLRDISAPIASGSFPTRGMIVAPCSIKTLSAIATSYSSELVARAADVTLKERRPLVLLVRETPFHLGHLRLMTQVAEMGGIIQPPVPAFYNRPGTITDLVDHSVGRALEHLGFDPPDLARWEGR
ncbi:MAG: UbiX family flavin prenyltransferase [Acidimicrobiia bacterium]|nr:UbiX family flavin prenyltransferase [Acidimicrobiia bacterium]